MEKAVITRRYIPLNLLFLQQTDRQVYNQSQIEQRLFFKNYLSRKEFSVMQKFVYEYATKVYFGEGQPKNIWQQQSPDMGKM